MYTLSVFPHARKIMKMKTLAPRGLVSLRVYCVPL
jgi:hypothetical protein